jgi:hypothetical protein
MHHIVVVGRRLLGPTRALTPEPLRIYPGNRYLAGRGFRRAPTRDASCRYRSDHVSGPTYGSSFDAVTFQSGPVPHGYLYECPTCHRIARSTFLPKCLGSKLNERDRHPAKKTSVVSETLVSRLNSADPPMFV